MSACLSCDCTMGCGGFDAILTIKKVNPSAGTVTVQPALSQTIDGASNFALAAQYKYVRLISDGASWQVIGSN